MISATISRIRHRSYSASDLSNYIYVLCLCFWTQFTNPGTTRTFVGDMLYRYAVYVHIYIYIYTVPICLSMNKLNLRNDNNEQWFRRGEEMSQKVKK